MAKQYELPAHLFIRVAANLSRSHVIALAGIYWRTGAYRLYNPQRYSRTSTSFIMSRRKKCCRLFCEPPRILEASVHFACSSFCLPALSESSTMFISLWHAGAQKKKCPPEVQLLCWSLVLWAILRANSWIDVLFNNTSMSTGLSLQARETFSLLPPWPVCSSGSCRVTPALFRHAQTRREHLPCIYLIPFWLWLKALVSLGLDVFPAWRPF